MNKKNTKKKGFLSEKSSLLFFSFGAVFSLVIVGAIVGVTEILDEGDAGTTVNVKHYGPTDTLMSSQPNTLQTKITFKQPTLMNLQDLNTRKIIASYITEFVDFAPGIVTLYENHPPVAPGDLSGLESAAGQVAVDFKENTKCLENIGLNRGGWGELVVSMVTDLKFAECNKKQDKYYAYVEHSFFNSDAVFICSQDSRKLFLADKETGDVETDTAEC